MQFGIHLSIAGGLEQAVKRARESGCECFQIFSRSPHGGVRKKISETEVAQFQNARTKAGSISCYIHTPYYINFGSSNPRIFHGSVAAVREEMETAQRLGARAVVTHLGSAKDLGREATLEKIADGIMAVFLSQGSSSEKPVYEKFKTKLLLEITAGSGNIVGDSFEEIATLVAKAEKRLGKNTLGVCFDTAHAFGSGYDLCTARAVQRTLDKFDQVVGLERLELVHLNDSLVDLGSHKDRHANWGEGFIGLQGLRAILADERLEKLDFVLETPPPANVQDLKLLKKLRSGEKK